MSFSPKWAVITGASSGLGKDFATELAKQKINLIIAARRVDRLEALAQELMSKFQIQVEVLTLDLALSDSAKELFNFSTKGNRQIDFLINNAGIGPYRSFLESSLEEHNKVIDLNIRSLTESTHFFVRHMKAHRRESAILNVSSVASYQPIPRFAVYCASKAYVRYFSQILNYELRGTNIRVSCLCPGGTQTDFLESNNQSLKLGKGILMTSERVVKTALKGVNAHKELIIPGIMNKLICFVLNLLPNSLNIILSEKAMNLAVKETDRS